jgi:branched-chain amino acid transport system ATP-binding protein
VIGANGAGKSTLLAAVAGMLPPAGGDVRFDGRSIRALPTHRRVSAGISLVPEGRRVFPSLTVRENLLVGAYKGRPGHWTLPRVFELFPVLEQLAGRWGNALSGGEQQMCAIGRALMANPRLLLLDELSLGLAPVVIKPLYATLATIAAEGTTVVLVEQDVTQALATAARAYCLLEGRISLHGETSKLSREQVVEAYFGV